MPRKAVVMWNPFSTASADADRALLREQMNLQHQQTVEMLQSMNATAGKMAEASKAQAESFTAYLSLFKVQSPPESRVMRDEDEYKEELRRSGFPVDADPQTQAQWVLAQTE